MSILVPLTRSNPARTPSLVHRYRSRSRRPGESGQLRGPTGVAHRATITATRTIDDGNALRLRAPFASSSMGNEYGERVGESECPYSFPLTRSRPTRIPSLVHRYRSRSRRPGEYRATARPNRSSASRDDDGRRLRPTMGMRSAFASPSPRRVWGTSMETE